MDDSAQRCVFLSRKEKIGYIRRPVIWNLIIEIAHYAVDWEQDGVKDSFFVVHGSSTHGWRRRARSRHNYFLFSCPVREADVLVQVSTANATLTKNKLSCVRVYTFMLALPYLQCNICNEDV